MFRTSPGSKHRSRHEMLGWATFPSLATVSLGVAVVLRVTPGRLGWPSYAAGLADVTAYLLLFLASLLLSVRSATQRPPKRVLVGALMIAMGLAAFVWYFITGPAILSGQEADALRVLRVARSALDLSLVTVFLLLLAHQRDRLPRCTLRIYGTGVGVLIAADMVQGYQIAHVHVVPALLINFARPVAFVLATAGVACGLWGAVRHGTSTPTWTRDMPVSQAPHVPAVWQYVLPYTLIPAVVALMIYAAHIPVSSHLVVVLYALGVILSMLVFVHQFLAYREILAFTHRSAHLETLAAADPITAMPNHRTIVARLDREIEHCSRYGRGCSVLFLDLDHFKALNDTYGHRAGDAALRELAGVICGALRSSDALGRWGGEEFLAVLPETSLAAARDVAERVRATVEAHALRATGGSHITCSFGLASYPGHAKDRDSLVELADRALYRAKGAGRNQVGVAGDVDQMDQKFVSPGVLALVPPVFEAAASLSRG